MKRLITYSRAVRNALQNDEPVVALESTILTHGLPKPVNLNVALQCEANIRAKDRLGHFIIINMAIF